MAIRAETRRAFPPVAIADLLPPSAAMADGSAPDAPAVPSDVQVRPLPAEVRARPDAESSPFKTALSKRPADWPAGERERAAARSRGAPPRMELDDPLQKTPVASASTGADEAPAVGGRSTRATAAQIALEPTALANRLEAILLRSHPVPAPSNEVSVVREVSNGIILVAKAAVHALFLSTQRDALMRVRVRDVAVELGLGLRL